MQPHIPIDYNIIARCWQKPTMRRCASLVAALSKILLAGFLYRWDGAVETAAAIASPYMAPPCMAHLPAQATKDWKDSRRRAALQWLVQFQLPMDACLPSPWPMQFSCISVMVKGIMHSPTWDWRSQAGRKRNPFKRV